jgi:hypothetical protein
MVECNPSKKHQNFFEKKRLFKGQVMQYGVLGREVRVT